MARGDRRGASGVGALAGARPPGPRGVGAPAPPLPASRRDGDLHPAADRHLPRAAGGDGGAPARPVGQGLVRGCRLPEDRPARAGDAVGGGALRGRDRPRARRADRPLPDPDGRSRRPSGRSGRPIPPAPSRSRAGRRCRCCRARGRRASTTSPSRWRWCARGRSRAAPCIPTWSGASGCGRIPSYRGPLRASLAGADPSRHAGDDRLPGAGDPGGDGACRVHRRRGRGAAPGDEPQALRGGDPRLSRAVHRRGEGAWRDGRRWRSASSSRSAASRGSGSRRPTRSPSACSPTSRPGCGSTTAPSSSARS